MSRKQFELFISTANKKQVRRLAEEIGIVNDDHSFDEFLRFLKGLIEKHEK